MAFNSFEYALFLPAVIAVHWILPRKRRNFFLLLGSYAFYGAWDLRFLGLLMLSTAVDFWVGLRLGEENSGRRRRLLLITSLAVNLGILATFKYSDFFVSSAAALLSRAGFGPHSEVLELVLPVGISFYTFKEISYVVDVFNKRITPCRSPLLFALFVAYFPQLVAGPIERAGQLMPHLQGDRKAPAGAALRGALGLIILGLFKKVVLADPMAPIVEQAFMEASFLGARDLLIGIVAFSIEIYADFSGYTDIARGSSRLLGIPLTENFRQPYLSRSITEFWRRWHVSLSMWLRDYLYIPLGGSRKGVPRRVVAVMVTMLLGGLWHGAGWTFAAWGALHGVFLVAEGRRKARIDPEEPVRARHLPAMLATFLSVCLAWVFFRAASFTQAFEYFQGILTLRPNDGLFAHGFTVLRAGVVLFLIDVLRRGLGHRAGQLRPFPLGLAWGAMVAALIVYSGTPVIPFIYRQF